MIRKINVLREGMVNLSDFFRSIFGPFKEQLCPDDLPRNVQEDFEKLYGRRPDLNWHQSPADHQEWSILYGHPGHEEYSAGLEFSEGYFFQEFEQMFQSFMRGFPLDFTPSMQGPPAIDLPPDLSSEMPSQESCPSHSESLRDRMLKGPDSPAPENDNFQHRHEGSNPDGFSLFHPFSLFSDMFKVPFGGLRLPHDEQVDRDLDSEVEKGTQSLDDILGQRNEHQMMPHVPRTSSSFSSVTIVDSNGVTQKRTTRRDSSGKEEVIVTRKIGDQTHTFTKRKDESGNEETQEDLVNIENNDGLTEFNEKWHHSKCRGKHPHLSDNSSSPLASIYDSVLEQFFPRR